MRRVAQIMRSDFLALPPSTPADEARALMRDEGVRHAVVVDRGALVGVVSHRDVGAARGNGGRRSRTLAEIMTRDVVTTTPHATIAAVAREMREARIGCLPVLWSGRVVGIVTTSDLIALLEVPPSRAALASPRRVERPRAPRFWSPNVDKHA